MKLKFSSSIVAVAVCAGLVAAAGMAGTKDQSATKKQKPPANEVANVAGEVAEDAEIEGILIINGTVNIDGVKIPKGQKKFHSPKTGKNYRIEWGRDDNVSVTEE